MMDNKDNIILYLRRLGLSDAEARIYLTLLNNPMSHLQLSRKTKINRTKVYRLVDNLKARGLINIEQRDDGKYLSTSEPRNLEIPLIDSENKLKAQKKVLDSILPILNSLYTSDQAKKDFFVVSTYEGTAGLKQMLWNELKSKGEICMFAHDTLDSLAGVQWAEKFRARVREADIKQRALENTEASHVLEKSEIEDYSANYTVRYLPRKVFNIQQELTIHDDTVSIYNWKVNDDALRVGVEIKNADFTRFMRGIFESFWANAEKPQSKKN